MLNTAILAAKEAGKILTDNFSKSHQIFTKKDLSLVSDIDKKAQDAIIKIISDKFPKHSILAEEGYFKKTESKYLWVVDPLDGTTNFLAGVPIFCVSIGLLISQQVVCGVIYQPITSELFYAEKDKGAYLNATKIFVSKKVELSNCLIGFNRGRRLEDVKLHGSVINKLSLKIRSPRIYGSIAYELAAVAAGKIDGVISLGPALWDCAAGVILISEAGGKITDFSNQKWQIGSEQILATNGKIHNTILEIIKSEIG